MEWGEHNEIPQVVYEPGSFFRLRGLIDRYFEVDSFSMSGGAVRLGFVSARAGRGEIRRAFRELGYRASFPRAGDSKFCVLAPVNGVAEKKRRRELRISLLLFILTFGTTTVSGWYFALGMVAAGMAKSALPGALGFSLGLLLILGSHEMAHKWASMRNGIDSSPPYFIPLPPSIPGFGLISFGTMGAIIQVRSPMPDRNSSVALGISGPLAGFLVSLPLLAAGLMLSRPVPIKPPEPGMLQWIFQSSLVFLIFEHLFTRLPEGYTYAPHTLVFAAWIGLFVTGLNLIPVGQLDGGHIAHAVFGPGRHRQLCWALIAALAVMGIFLWQGWLLWSVIGFFLTRRGYPRSMDESKPLSRLSWFLAAVGLIILILCFLPMPMEIV